MATAYFGGGSDRRFADTTLTVTINSIPAGAAIAYWYDAGTTNISSISDGTNNLTLVGSKVTVGGVSGQGAYMANSPGGNLTFTLTLGASAAGLGMIVHAITGAATASVLDASNAVATAYGGGTDNISVSVTTTQAGDYIFGFDANASQNGAVTAGTGFAQRVQFAANQGVSQDIESYGSAGTLSVLFTDGSFDNHITVVLALKAAAAGGTLKTFNGLPIASIKTFDGLAKASTKTVNGLTP